MKRILILAVIAVAGCRTAAPQTQTAAAPQTVPAVPHFSSTPQEQYVPAVTSEPVSDGLSDLGALTFECPKAGLNAAAREAATVPSQGTYQFSYFRIINDSHHASYEVHFRSNVVAEPDLKYCVNIYCQQGWDPRTTKASVTLSGTERQRARNAANVTVCANTAAPANRGSK